MCLESRDLVKFSEICRKSETVQDTDIVAMEDDKSWQKGQLNTVHGTKKRKNKEETKKNKNWKAQKKPSGL